MPLRVVVLVPVRVQVLVQYTVPVLNMSYRTVLPYSYEYSYSSTNIVLVRIPVLSTEYSSTCTVQYTCIPVRTGTYRTRTVLE